jgi:hypothetical protein
MDDLDGDITALPPPLSHRQAPLTVFRAMGADITNLQAALAEQGLEAALCPYP